MWKIINQVLLYQDHDMGGRVEQTANFQQEPVAEETEQTEQGNSAVENVQQENVQQENVQQNEHSQQNTDIQLNEPIQQENAEEEPNAEEEFQQEPLDVEPLAKGHDEVCIPEQDLIDLAEELAKFNSWRRIRNLLMKDFYAAMSTDLDHLQELELWALKFCKDIPAEEISDRLTSKFYEKTGGIQSQSTQRAYEKENS